MIPSTEDSKISEVKSQLSSLHVRLVRHGRRSEKRVQSFETPIDCLTSSCGFTNNGNFRSSPTEL